MFQRWFAELLLEAAGAGGGAGGGPGAGAGAGAGGEAPAAGSPFGNLASFLPFLLVIVIFWLLVFRPESRRRKDLERQIAGVKKGDTVVTTGGLVGKVWRVDAQEIVFVVDKDKDVRARVLKSAIQGVLKEEGGSGRGPDGSQAEPGKS